MTTRRFVRIDRNRCVGCGICVRFCTVGTVLELSPRDGKARMARPWDCGGCLTCASRCPNGAIAPLVIERAGLVDYTEREPRAPGQ